jgi:hypothetical protein
MKKVILFLALTAIAAGVAFTQEKEAYIKPTFGIGFATGNFDDSSSTLAALGLDIDFVTAIGLTFGAQLLQAWNSDVSSGPFPTFGVGYTYTADKWSAGGKLMAVPYSSGGMGIDGNGTWWFNKFLGVTGVIDAYFGMGATDWTIVSVRAGISAKF